MSQLSVKMNNKSRDINKTKAEIEEMLSRFGWKWAVLASTMSRLYRQGNSVPSGMVNLLRMSRTQIESGCYSVCDVANELRKIEMFLFSELLKSGPYETDNFLELLSKAIGGKISRDDLDINGAEPILADCLTLPCVCRE
ncbi:MAG: hypothetical protein JSW11_08080 [Candidatus Heimdallarchaeota archaeon]|nr:MAG: hypothetical protein JSW11_08080 [Candidatus Heimdallarchaeota archaeon]